MPSCRLTSPLLVCSVSVVSWTWLGNINMLSLGLHASPGIIPWHQCLWHPRCACDVSGSTKETACPWDRWRLSVVIPKESLAWAWRWFLCSLWWGWRSETPADGMPSGCRDPWTLSCCPWCFGDSWFVHSFLSSQLSVCILVLSLCSCYTLAWLCLCGVIRSSQFCLTWFTQGAHLGFSQTVLVNFRV